MWYKKSFDMGNNKAGYNTAVCYDDLYEYDNAIKWYKIKFKTKYLQSKSMYNIGYIYHYKLKKYNEALKWYKKADELGNAEASRDVGIIYDTKLKDYQNAMIWYKKSVQFDYKIDFKEDLYNLGRLYDYRLKDYKNAIIWYKKAEKSNHKFATFNLGYLYESFMKDYNSAILFYEKSYYLGHSLSAYLLGKLYADNKQVKNLKNAIKWYTLGYENFKDKDCAYALALLYKYEKNDYNQSAIWHENASKLGQKVSSFYAANIYLNRLNNPKKALKLFKEAYNKEDKNYSRKAAYQIGFIYEKKYKDDGKATLWYKKSADKGSKKGLKKYTYFKNK